MKTSSKVLLGTAIAVIGLIFVGSVAARISVGSILEEVADIAEPGPTVERSFSIEGFTALDVSGVWEVTIAKGDYAVSVHAPENLFEHLGVESRGAVLHLDPRRVDSNIKLRASVSMPALEALDISGVTKVELSDMETERFIVDLSGASKIVSRGGRIGTLELDLSGVSKVNFSETPTTHASVDLSGASHTELWMQGGRLEGDISGASSITYRGHVSSETVNISGVSKVTQR